MSTKLAGTVRPDDPYGSLIECGAYETEDQISANVELPMTFEVDDDGPATANVYVNGYRVIVYPDADTGSLVVEVETGEHDDGEPDQVPYMALIVRVNEGLVYEGTAESRRADVSDVVVEEVAGDVAEPVTDVQP